VTFPLPDGAVDGKAVWDADFARRAEAVGCEYVETPAAGVDVDASCRCGGWHLWEIGPTLAVMTWRYHASAVITDHEGQAS